MKHEDIKEGQTYISVEMRTPRKVEIIRPGKNKNKSKYLYVEYINSYGELNTMRLNQFAKWAKDIYIELERHKCADVIENDEEVFYSTKDESWLLGSYHRTRIIYCPYCGLELEKLLTDSG